MGKYGICRAFLLQGKIPSQTFLQHANLHFMLTALKHSYKESNSGF